MFFFRAVLLSIGALSCVLPGRVNALNDKLNYKRDGTWTFSTSEALPYNKGQDFGAAGEISLGSDGKAATLLGNAWRRFKIEPYDFKEHTILTFSVELITGSEISAICIEGDDGVQDDYNYDDDNYYYNDGGNDRNCFVFGGTDFNDCLSTFNLLDNSINGVGSEDYLVYTGEYFTGIRNSIVLAQGKKKTSSSIGKMIVKNITILDPTISTPPSPSPTISKTPSITLAETSDWSIFSDGDVTEESLSSDIIQISLPFNTSNRDYAAKVFTNDCLTPFNNSAFDVSTSDRISVEPDGFVQFNSTLTMNITSINGTVYWNKFSDGTQGGWVEVCVQTFLWFNDTFNLNDIADAIEIPIFKNNLLNISVSLTSEFSTSTGVSVEIESSDLENIQTDYSDEIVVYECDVNDPEKDASGKTYTQGSTLTICVTTKDTTLVQVQEFFNLFVTQEDERYNYIRNGRYNEDITTPNCRSIGSKKVCQAELLLLARFFSESSPKDLTLSGTIFLLRNDQIVNRNLKISLKSPDMNEGKDSSGVISERRLKEVSGGNGEFSLEVSLQPTVYGYSDASMNYGSGPMGAMIKAAGVIGAAIMAY